jgi:hypothetical protein
MSTSDYKDAAVQFLLKPENLEVALEIDELVRDVKDKLVLEFWHALKSKVCEGQSELPAWTINLDSDKDLLKGGYAGLDCVPDIASTAQRYLKFSVEQGGGTIYQGVCWNKEMKTPFDELSKKFPELSVIRDRLQQLSKEYAKMTSWWIGWKYLNNGRGLREKTTLLQIQRGGLPIEAAEEFLELVENMREPVEEANSKLQAIV